MAVPVARCLPLEASAQELFEAAGWDTSCALLESPRLSPSTGRYSVLVGNPYAVLTAKAGEITLQRGPTAESFQGNPLTVVQDLLREKPVRRMDGFPPFVGGGVGFLGFDAYRYLEPLPFLAEDDLGLPDVGFLFFDEAAVCDHLLGKLWLIALADPAEGARGYDRAAGRVEELAGRLTGCPPDQERFRRPFTLRPLPFAIQSTHTRVSFERMVREAKEFIARGEIYQANLSQRFSLPLMDNPWFLYRRLTQVNPSPFACFGDFPGRRPGERFQVVSASPERLFRVRNRLIETRPIAGTRPRGRTPVQTALLRQELILNEKERAEHLMLVDLERNDLGRVCRFGSVEVDELMVLEEYSHVIHIVSNVRGMLKPAARFQDLAAAVFPGGTVTGCPKIRCVEIIDALEPVRRQLYTGSLGYISFSGDIDFNILIRTGLAAGGSIHVHAGAGIVADSDPSREFEETLHKAQALLDVFSCAPETVAGHACP
ncbi:MAG: anthranilate synthase component I family protein [Candidatus Omnitrophica bacterium]|nr:anthranilate synthase component I family protein [Candidatus Omnitrophota bacterium]